MYRYFRLLEIFLSEHFLTIIQHLGLQIPHNGKGEILTIHSILCQTWCGWHGNIEMPVIGCFLCDLIHLRLLHLHLSYSGADICDKCWPLMAFAVKVIDRALRGMYASVASFRFEEM